MKRIILLSLCLLLCLSAAHAQKLAIKGLSTQSIQIGNKTLTKGNVFNANEKIHWSVKGQSMRLMFQDGEKRGLFITVCREAMERIGAENVTQYLCWCNQTWFERFKSNFGLIVNNKPSSRSSVELMEKTASNFPEKRLALVIGNSNYEYLDPLANPLNDVTKVGEKLQSLGFDVLPVYDADDREINSKLNWLKRQSKYDVVIVYYSGHGIQNGNKQYLIPVNGKLDDENDLDYCISLEDVYKSLNALGKDKTKMVFVDACRNQGKWQSKIEADSRQEGEDIAVLYSTSTGSKASDGEAGENSPFAKAFLEEIGNPTDNVTTTIGKIKNAVKEKSNQIPIDINFTGQTFTFNPHGTEKTQQAGISLKTDYEELCSVAAGELDEIEIGYSAWSNGGGGYHGACINVDINSSVNTLRDGAFKDCDGIESIRIPASVTRIGKRIFKDSRTYLSYIEISPDNLFYDSREGCNAIIEKATNTLIEGCQFTEIPKSVTKIGDYAFEGCDRLDSIFIPNNVTEIGRGAFTGCTGLENITIPSSVKTIGNAAFYGCTGLKSITIPESVEEIGDSVFFGCSKLQIITIPETLTSIGESAFEDCTGIKNITIPESVTYIGDNAFKNCTEIESINVPQYLEEIGNGIFCGCKKIDNIIIPKSVTNIGDDVFFGCIKLKSITIPHSVTGIGQRAFYGCRSLTNVSIPKSVIKIEEEAFDETPWFKDQPNGLVYAGLVAYKYKGQMPSESSISIKEGTISISDRAFQDCNRLVKITIPSSVTSIGNYSFHSCEGLETVNIPKSVIEIGGSAFYGCTRINDITIPMSVTTIGDHAFAYCRNLTSISIPNSVTNVGSEAFKDTPWFDNQPDGLVYIGSVAYTYKGEMPEGTTINLKQGTTSIADEAFMDLSSLTSIIIPNSVKCIGDGAFLRCQLDSIKIPNSVKYIGGGAFEKNPLISVEFPESLEYLGYAVLYGCEIERVVFPNSIMFIDDDPFAECTINNLYVNFKTLPDYQWALRNNAFQSRKSCTLHVPKGCKEAYENEEPWCDFKEIVDDL